MLCLSAWGNAWVVHKLDPKRLFHWCKLILSQDDFPETQGFATYESIYGIFSRFYAVYGYENRFYFQAGMRRWDLTDGEVDVDLQFSKNGMASTVKIFHKKILIYKAFHVHIFRGIFMAIDPTFDGIDAEHSFIFLFLKNQMPKSEWRQRVKSK